ncbi:MAG: preprotein translocase subunit SecY [bacterium]
MKNFWEKLTKIFKTKELRNKIYFVLGLLIVFRIAASIPVPGVDISRLRQFLSGNAVLGLFNLFSGGGLTHLSVVMLGVGPFITVEIIMQVLTIVFPRLEAMNKLEGEAGRQKFEQLVRYLAVPIAALQSLAMILFLRSPQVGVIKDDSTFTLVMTVIAATAGSMFLVWIGELITEKNIGHGISIIIFAGIISSLPSALRNAWINRAGNMEVYLIFIIMTVLIIAGIIIITEGQRNIPVFYARRTGGQYGSAESHVPLRVNQAGMIPIIFAMSIMVLPRMYSQFFAQSKTVWLQKSAIWSGKFFGNMWIYGVIYFLMVIGFTYFYTAISFDPKQVADSLQKQGGFVPGVRQGKPTADFLAFIMNRITLAGALFLGMIAVLPFIGEAITKNQSLTLGGAGILIVVGVALEIMHQLNSQLVMRDYEGM